MIAKPIQQLAQIQKRDKLSDRQVAERLGCSRVLWQMTRTGRVPLGHKVILGIFQGFPELHTSMSVFLANSADESSKDAAGVS